MGDSLAEEAMFLRLPKSLFDRLNRQTSRLTTSRTMLVRMAIVKYIEELESNDPMSSKKNGKEEV